MFGREAKLPSDSWIEDFSKLQGINMMEYSDQLAQALTVAWDTIANDRTERDRHTEALQQRQINLHDSYIGYVPGEKFYLRTIPQRFVVAEDERQYKLMSKLQYRYTGPHTVLEEINPVVFRANVNGVVRTVHANKMKEQYQGPRNREYSNLELNRERGIDNIPQKI
jgi:hypothetical protein